MKILILGGTKFLGRALVEAALDRGHSLSLYNRGKTNPELFPEVEKIHGDRAEGISGLGDKTWDVVIDTNGYIPRIVRQNAQELQTHSPHYTFISTISVYADVSRPGVDEQAPVAKTEDELAEQVTGDNYGPLKALCEQEVERIFPGNALIIRPGLIVGRHDPTDRFTYWPYRVSQGGVVLAPGHPDRVVQFIDVRDLAEWTIRMVEQQQTGIYNATGFIPEVTLGNLLEACRQVSGSDARIEWVNESFLLENKVEPWSELPVWVPESTGEFDGFFKIDIRKAVDAGLTFRPVADTVRDTLDWLRSRPQDEAWKAGLSRERESVLLEVWEKQTT